MSETKIPDTGSEKKCYVYAARFLDEQDKTKAFEILYKLVSETDDTFDNSLSPEKKIAKLIGVTTQVVYDWKRKEKIPGEKNSAKIMAELLKRDPQLNNKEIKTIAAKVGHMMLQSYILFLDQLLFNFYEIQSNDVVDDSMDYFKHLLNILLYNQGFRPPNRIPPEYGGHYIGQPIGLILNFNTKGRILNNSLPDFNQSKQALEELLTGVQSTYDKWNP